MRAGEGPSGSVAAAALVLMAVVALTGCSALPLPFGGGQTAPMDAVPRNVDYVGHVDYQQYRQQPQGVRTTTRAALSFQSRVVFYDGPEFLDSLAFSDGTRLDRQALQSVTYFGRENGSYGARVLRAGWNETDVVAAVESRRNVTLSKGSHAGRTLYLAGNGSVAVAVLPEGYAVGSPAAVRDAVEVSTGDAEAVSGRLRKAFERETGYVRFAFRFHPRKVPDLPLVQTDSFEKIRIVSAGYYVNGTASGTAADGGDNATRMGVAINLSVADRNAADQVRALLNSAVTLYRTHVANPALARELERVQLATENRRVAITYESTPDGFRTLLDGLRQNPGGGSGSGAGTG